MSSILDGMLKPQQFTPATTDEFVALQMAQLLHDEDAVRRYVHYVTRLPMAYLLQVLNDSMQSDDPATIFHSSLKQSEL